MQSTKRASSPSSDNGGSSKRTRQDTSTPPTQAGSSTAKPPSLHAWLHPDLPAPLQARSPPLNSGNSTFISFTISFLPPAHVSSEASLAKEARRMVRELDVVSEVGALLLEQGDGAFQGSEGRAPGRNGKGKERAREPDHRMWACRTLCLREGRDGTGGEDDYHLVEAYNDDGEKFGGERVLKVLREGKGVDVLTICCRWFGGDMLGPARFQHIGLTAHTSMTALVKMVTLRDLRQTLESLDEEIQGLRDTLKPPGSPLQELGAADTPPPASQGKYDGIEDTARLERLVKAKERTKASLEGRAGWAGLEQARAETLAASVSAR